MNRLMYTRLCAAAVFAVSVVIAGSAHAQLVDQVMGSALGGAMELGAAAPKPISSATIMQNLQRQGYSNVAAVPGDDPTQYTATAPGGIPVNIQVNLVTGQLVSAVPR